jgi:hypothetical protein
VFGGPGGFEPGFDFGGSWIVSVNAGYFGLLSSLFRRKMVFDS